MNFILFNCPLNLRRHELPWYCLKIERAKVSLFCQLVVELQLHFCLRRWRDGCTSWKWKETCYDGTILASESTYILYASVLMYSRTWLMPSRYCSVIGCTHGFSSILNTDLLLLSSKFAISGGITVKRLFWMCSSRKRGSSPISRGSSSRSLSRHPSYNNCAINAITSEEGNNVNLRSASFSYSWSLEANTRSRCHPNIRHEAFLQMKQQKYWLNRLNNWTLRFLTKFEEIPWQNIFIQVIVRQIQHFKDRKSTETAKNNEMILMTLM